MNNKNKDTGLRSFIRPGAWLLVLSLAMPGLASAELLMTSPPRESAAKGQQMYGPVAQWLSELLGEKVTYEHPKSWLHYQRDIRADRFDIVYDGPHFISWRIKKYGHRPVAKLPGKLGFYAIVRADDDRVHQVSDLVNKKVCVIAPPNLSSLTLLNEFRDPIRQPRLLTVRGGMPGVFKAFKAGKCQAAVLRDQFFRKKLSDEDKASVRIVYRSPLYTNQGFTVSSRIDDARLGKMREAMTQEQAVLKPLLKRFAPKADHMLAASEDDYQSDYKLLSGIIIGWEVD